MPMSMKYVVDTSSLMQNLTGIDFSEIIISSIVLHELEKHKSDTRFPERQFAARQALRAIEEHDEVVEYDFHQYPTFVHLPDTYDLHYTDNRLLEALLTHQQAGRNVGLMTEDLALRLQAKSFGFPVKSAQDVEHEPYQGTKIIHIDDHRVAHFFNMVEATNVKHDNLFDLQKGEYLLMNKYEAEEEKEEIIGAWVWDGERYDRIKMKMHFDSAAFGKVKPMNYRQAVAMHSIQHNPITAITGDAGTGKTYVAMSYIMQEVENYRPVYIVTNNVPLRGTNTFGLKKGNITEKILQSNLGGILKSKIGVIRTQELIQQGLINVVPIEDIRGCSYDSILYITEVQNYTVDMIKTVLERMENGGKVIFDGDKRQIDSNFAKGANNGLERMFEIFQGSGYLGHVELIGNVRGGVSELAGKM